MPEPVTGYWTERERENKSTVVLRANIKQKVQISFTQLDIKKV